MVEYTYDAHGNVTQKVQKTSLSATESAYRTVYTYDADGRRTSMTDYQTTGGTESVITESSYGYDTLNRVTGYVQDGSPVSYTYNDDGTVASIAYPGTLTVPDDETLNSQIDNTYFTINYNYIYKSALDTYVLDTIGVIQPQTSNEVTVRDYDYLTDGRIDQITDTVGFDTSDPTNVIEAYTYNGLGLVSNITYTQDNTVKESYDYTYDSRGYIATESILNNYFTTAKDADFAYTYDTIGRLTTSAYTDNTTSTTTATAYTYDNVGNRLSKSNSQYTYSYTIGAYNQVSAITKTLTGSSTTVEASNFTYDVNGNTTGESTTTYSTETQNGTTFDVRTSLTKAYSYDYTNMMSAANVSTSVDAKISGSSDPYTNSASDSASDTYVYNGDGQRVKKITGGITTKYYYTGSVVLYTADADNNKISGNIATPSGEIIATKDYANATNADGSANTFANKYYFYHYDIRGSVTTLLKPDATFEQGYSYDEYGNTTVENSASLFHNEMSYTGAISDSTTGLSYMNARYYNPATGTFTSQDTYYGSAYSPWTQHLYSYTGGNPVNYTDPTGHRFIKGDERLDGNKSTGVFDNANYQNYKTSRASNVANDSSNNSAGEDLAPLSISTTAIADSAVMGDQAYSMYHFSGLTVKPKNLDWGSWGVIAENDAYYTRCVANATKWANATSAVCVVADITIGVVQNVNAGASNDEIVSDAATDCLVSGGGVLAGLGTVALTGMAFGTAVCPVLGTAIGLTVSVLWYLYFDVEWRGEPSRRERIKDYVYTNQDIYNDNIGRYVPN